jgi:toxin ParE1/3/4
VKIRWTPVAFADLRATHEFLSQESQTQADAVIDRILSGIDMLEKFPNLGREGRIDGTREFVVSGTPFIIFYRLQDDQVEILGVVHGARKWPGG